MRVLLFLLVLSASSQLYALHDVCSAEFISVKTDIHWLRDETLKQDPAKILDEIVSADHMIDVKGLAPFFSRHVDWFYFRLFNSTDQPCTRLLTVGDPRIESVQVHQFKDQNWHSSLAGSRHALNDWSARDRLVTFPVLLDPYQSVDVLVQLQSRTLIPLRFELYDSGYYAQQNVHKDLFEGIMIGLVVSAIAVGFVVAYLLRSSLLALVTAILLFYFPITLIVNGYLVYIPGLLGYTISMLAILNLIVLLLWGVFLYRLFKLRDLPRWLRITYIGSFGFGVVLMLLALVHDFGVYSPVFSSYRELSYLLYIVVFLFVWLQRVKLSWLAILLGSFLLIQGAALHLLSIRDSAVYYADSNVSVFSNALLIVILLATAISSISQNNQKVEKAKRALTRQRENEKTRLENMVALRTAQLKKMLDSRTYLLASLSHDLRSPIANIVHRAQALQLKQSSESIAQIEMQARQHLDMLDELLSLSRDNFQQLALNVEVGYTHAFLEEVASNARETIMRNNNEFVLEVSEGLPPLLKADFKLLRRILINLLENAGKFTLDGRVKLVVEAQKASSDQVSLKFMVQDSGVGLDAEQKMQLLQPFQRGEGTEDVSGYGLGLSIVKDLLALMESQLELADAPDGGACFYFNLQLELAHEIDTEEYFIERYEQSVSGTGLTVLLVDDEEAVTDCMEQLLLGYDFDVRTAQSGEGAISILNAGHVDVVITDQKLQGFTGQALLSIIKERWPNLPVILYSSSPVQPANGSECETNTFDAVILKPADTTMLLKTILDLTSR